MRPITPAPMSPIRTFLTTSDPQRLHVRPVPPRALQRLAHPRRQLILHDDPAAVIPFPQLIKHRREIDIAFAQPIEDASANSGEVIPRLRPRLSGDCVVTVLEVHVPYALPEPFHRTKRMAFGIGPVTRVEAQPEQLGRGRVEQPTGLLRRFDKASAVVVEDRAQPCLVQDRPRDTFSPAREVSPLFGAQALPGPDPPREPGTHRVRPVVIREDYERPAAACAAACAGSEQPRCAQRCFHTFTMP